MKEIEFNLYDSEGKRINLTGTIAIDGEVYTVRTSSETAQLKIEESKPPFCESVVNLMEIERRALESKMNPLTFADLAPGMWVKCLQDSPGKPIEYIKGDYYPVTEVTDGTITIKDLVEEFKWLKRKDNEIFDFNNPLPFNPGTPGFFDAAVASARFEKPIVDYSDTLKAYPLTPAECSEKPAPPLHKGFLVKPEDGRQYLKCVKDVMCCGKVKAIAGLYYQSPNSNTIEGCEGGRNGLIIIGSENFSSYFIPA